MRIFIDLGSSGMEQMSIDVEPYQSIENVIALITVKNNHIDFERAQLFYNG